MESRYIVIATLMRRKQGKQTDKYILRGLDSADIIEKAPFECRALMDNGVDIVGLIRNDPNSVRPSGFFSHRGIIGVEEADYKEVYTIIRRYVGKTSKVIELSDTMGKTQLVTEEQLTKMIDEDVLVNGVKRRGSSLTFSRAIPIRIGW